MSKNLNSKISKACKGLELDDYGLIETDEQLRSEVINTKLDYVADTVRALAQFLVDFHSDGLLKSAEKYNQAVTAAKDAAEDAVAHAIQQYKKRKAADSKHFSAENAANRKKVN